MKESHSVVPKSEWWSVDKLPSKLILLSDLHIGVLDPEQDVDYQNVLIRFLDQKLHDGYSLFLLGDIFDYWLEYDAYVPPVGEAFRHFLENTSYKDAIAIVTGNHDNWTENYFSSKGIREMSEGIRYSNKALFCHGDGFKNDDLFLKRPFKHRLLRNRHFIQLFKWLFNRVKAWQIMANYSRNSALSHSDDHNETQRLDNWANTLNRNLGFELLVCGHDHRARITDLENGYLLNCGYFLKERTFGVLEESTLKLFALEANLDQRLLDQRILK